MADSTLKVTVSAGTSSAVKNFENLALAADSSSTKMQTTFGKIGDKIKSAGSSIVSGFGPAGSLLQNLPIFAGPVGEMFSTMSETTQGLGEKFDALGEEGSGAFKKIGAGMAGAGLGLAGLGAGLDELSSPLEASQNELKQSITNTGGSFDDYSAKIAAADSKMQNLGIRNQDTNQALAALTTGLKSPQKALDDLGLAADLAATKHESLTTAAASLVRLAAGSGTKVLTSLGISVTDVSYAAAKGVKPHVDLGLALAKLGQVTHDQAEASMDTFGGKLDIVKDKVLDGAAQIGQKYGPALMGVGAGMTIVGGALDAGKSLMDVFSKSTEAAAAATDVLSTSTDALSGSEDAAAASEGLALAPILLIIAGIAVLAAAIYELVTHWSTVWGAIQSAAHDAWTFIDTNVFQPIEDFFTVTIPNVASDVIGWFKDNWPLLVAILTRPIGLVVLEIAKHWTTIKTDAGNLIGDIVGFFTGLPDKVVTALGDFAGKVWSLIMIGSDWLDTNIWTPVENFFTGLPGKITSIAKGMWDGIADAFVDAINGVIGIWNNFHIPAIHVLGVQVSPEINFPNLPTVPHLAAGGIVPATNGGMLALLGEGGNDEAVIPLGRHGGTAGGGDTYIENVNINGAHMTPQDVINVLRQFTRTSGSLASAGIK